MGFLDTWAPNGGSTMGMAPFVRRELIEKADEIVRLARTISDRRRSATLRKAAEMYRQATLSLMAEIIEEEADDWDNSGS
jgi:vacuolar-type H+-ATPase subunit E/Vma4